MSVSTKQMRLLHVARNRLDIPEASWRQMLAEVGGVQSATELTQESYTAMLGLMEHLGFRPAAPVRDFGERPGMASRKQIAFIRSLWRSYTQHAYATDRELELWLKKKWRVDSLRFLDAATAPKVITALLAMEARAKAARAADERKTATA